MGVVYMPTAEEFAKPRPLKGEVNDGCKIDQTAREKLEILESIEEETRRRTVSKVPIREPGKTFKTKIFRARASRRSNATSPPGTFETEEGNVAPAPPPRMGSKMFGRKE